MVIDNIFLELILKESKNLDEFLLGTKRHLISLRNLGISSYKDIEEELRQYYLNNS